MRFVLIAVLAMTGGCAQMQAKWDNLSPGTQKWIVLGGGVLVGAAAAHDHGDTIITQVTPPDNCFHHCRD